MSTRHLLFFTLLLLNLILYAVVLDAKTYFQPQVVIAPHHDLVKTERQAVLKAVARRRPQTQTIILLSPDHFNPNQHLITSSDQDWTTAQGPLSYDRALGEAFKPQVINNPIAVKNDHGLYALLPDIKALFPEANLVPLLLGQALTPKDLKSISETINQTCLTDCLLLASVDFSHYLPATLANIHDAYSLKALSNLDHDIVMTLEVDSPQSLYLALAHAPARFIQKKHTNSGEMLQNYDVETTSHILGWFQKGQPLPLNHQTFLYATNLSPKDNQKTVGDRFFYGADVTNTLLSSPQSPAPNLTIQPSSVSSLNFSNHDLTVNLSLDLAVAGTVSPSGDWQLILLPLTNQSFTRGPTKRAFLERLFANLPPPFQVDLDRGTITYSK